MRKEMICIENVVSYERAGHGGGGIGAWGGREAGAEGLYSEVWEPLLITGKLG